MAIAVALSAIPVSIAIPLAVTLTAIALDYFCSGQILGMNTCAVLRFAQFPALVRLNLAAWKRAARTRRSASLK